MFTGARYARSGNVNIAYQVVGEGPVDLVLVLGWVSHLAYVWELPALASFLDRLASFSRLILFDKRGCGMSDRVHSPPTMEQRMDDVRAVLDAVGSEKAALLGISEGGVMSALFAARYPMRTAALIINGSYPSWLRGPGYPWGRTEEVAERLFATVKDFWGKDAGLDGYAPSQVDNLEVVRWWIRFMQMSASPGDAEDLLRMNLSIDIGHILPGIQVPTLVIHARGDRVAPFEGGRYLADHIPHARLVELRSDDHWPYFGDADAVIGEVQQLLTGVRGAPSPRTMLATVLCTEVPQAAAHALWMGERRWNELVDRHHHVVRRALRRYSGVEAEAGARGITATFDGTARAIRCALDIRDELLQMGLRIRAGLHAGECDLHDGRPHGIPLHVAASLLAVAEPGEVVVSGTVRDLVTGSDLEFVDRSVHAFPGVPGSWRVYAVGGVRLLPIDRPSAAVGPAARLTRRERDVAELVACGHSNRGIAERLFVSERTVDNHVHHILNKLGFDSRVQVATWVAKK